MNAFFVEEREGNLTCYFMFVKPQMIPYNGDLEVIDGGAPPPEGDTKGAAWHGTN